LLQPFPESSRAQQIFRNALPARAGKKTELSHLVTHSKKTRILIFQKTVLSIHRQPA
jgi:hypothetical protein